MPIKLQIGGFLHRSAGLFILIGLVIPSILGVIYRLHNMPTLLADGPLPAGMAYGAGLLAFIPIVLAILVAVRKKPIEISLVTVIVLLGIVVRIIYIYSFDQGLTSDYKTMWTYALSVSKGELLLNASTMQEMRTIPYMLPMAVLSDGSRIWVEIANALITIFSAFLIYWIARDIAGNNAGVSALILVLFAPEPLFSSEIVTHDIPGIFFMLLSIVCFYLVLRKWRENTGSLLAYSVLMISGSLFLALSEIQRNTGPFLFAGLITALCMLYCGMSRDSLFKPRNIVFIVSLVLLPLIAISAMKTALYSCCASEASIASITRLSIWGSVAIFGGPKSVGAYAEFKEMKPVLSKIPSADLPSYAINKLVSEYISEPFLGLAKHYAHKSERLFYIGRQGGEYYGDSEYRQIYDAYTAYYAIALLSMSVVVLLAVGFVIRQPPELLLPVFVLSWLSLWLISFGEIQSRYIVLIWYVMPIYISILLKNRFT